MSHKPTPDNLPSTPDAPALPSAAAGVMATPSSAASPHPHHAWEDAPPLARDSSFAGMTLTQFLGAFNDNLFKQLVLLIATTAAVGAVAAGNLAPADVAEAIKDAAPAAAAVPADAALPAAAIAEKAVKSIDRQGLAMFLFATPFILFSGLAGFLADRYSKRTIAILSKVAEIAIMTLGMVAFFMLEHWGLAGLLVVLFLMGAQSAFFGPAKYGILPEMLHGRDLPKANGIIQMTTFLAIIFGMATAGWLLKSLSGTIWVASLICVGIAIAGTCTSLLVRRVPIANPGAPLHVGVLLVPREILDLLWRDRPLRSALLASCMFWFIGALVQPTVNALGKIQLGLDDHYTSILAAGLALGIGIGCLLAGYLSRGKVNASVVRCGAWGIVATFALLTLPIRLGSHALGYWTTFGLLTLAGGFAGMFIVPIQVFLQSRPPEQQKGRMIGTMNLFNWIAVAISALVYEGAITLVEQLGWQRSALFVVTILLMLPVAIFYHPADERLPA